MTYQATTTTVSATVSLRVPRGGSESLESGVADVLGAVGPVREVSVDRLHSVRPGFTDIRVEAAATLAVAVSETGDPETAVARRLAEGFGVEGVDAVSA